MKAQRRGRLPCRPASSRRARLEAPDILIDKSAPRLQSADVCMIIDIDERKGLDLFSMRKIQFAGSGTGQAAFPTAMLRSG